MNEMEVFQSDLSKHLQMNVQPYFSVKRRLLLESERAENEVHSYSIHTVAKHLFKEQKKTVRLNEKMGGLQTQSGCDSSVQNEDLDILLGELNFRLNHVQLSSMTDDGETDKVDLNSSDCKGSKGVVLLRSGTSSNRASLWNELKKESSPLVMAKKKIKDRTHPKDLSTTSMLSKTEDRSAKGQSTKNMEAARRIRKKFAVVTCLATSARKATSTAMTD